MLIPYIDTWPGSIFKEGFLTWNWKKSTYNIHQSQTGQYDVIHNTGYWVHSPGMTGFPVAHMILMAWDAVPSGILTTSTCEITFDKKCSVLLDQKISISCFLIPLHFTNIFKAINFLKIHTWIVFLYSFFQLVLKYTFFLIIWKRKC